MHPQALDWPFENALTFLDRKARFGYRICEVTRGNRAVELAAFARLANDYDTQAFESGADFGRFRLSLQIVRFELGALALKIGYVFLSRSKGLLFRQQIIARKARLHLHKLTHLTEL